MYIKFLHYRQQFYISYVGELLYSHRTVWNMRKKLLSVSILNSVYVKCKDIMTSCKLFCQHLTKESTDKWNTVMFPLMLLLCAQHFDITTFVDMYVCQVFGNADEIRYVQQVLHKYLNISYKVLFSVCFVTYVV
jgi:hypothetical protein